MKALLTGVSICLALSAFGLDISPEGRKEAQLFNTFLEAVYAQRTGSTDAVSALEKTLSLAPDSKYLRRSIVAVALAANQPERAEPYVNFFEQGENEAEDFAVYGAYLWKQGKTEDARTAYEQALALAADEQSVLYPYLLLLGTLDEEQLVGALERLVSQHPSLAASLYMELGRLYVSRRNPEKALAYFDKAATADPADPAPHLAKGELYEYTSQFFLMLHEFETVEKLGHGNAGMFSRMAAVFLLVKDTSKAETYFLKAKTLDPSEVAANHFLALLAEQKGDIESALTYVQAAADFPINASRWLQASFYLRRLNRREESLQLLAQAYQKFSKNVEIGFFYGLALNDEKKYKEAVRVFKKILQTNPDYPTARLHYAYSLESLQKYSEMERQLRVLLQADSQNAPALNLWAYSLAERDTRLDEAYEYITRALAVSPNDISFMDTLGWIYIRQEKWDEADKIFSSFSKEDIQRNPEIAYHIGVLRLKQGRTQEALVHLEQARNGWPAAQQLYRRLSHNSSIP